MDPDAAILMNLFLWWSALILGGLGLWCRQMIIDRQREEIDGLRYKLSRKALFGFDDEADADEVFDEFCSDLERIQGLIARGFIKDASLEIERALEHYA